VTKIALHKFHFEHLLAAKKQPFADDRFPELIWQWSYRNEPEPEIYPDAVEQLQVAAKPILANGMQKSRKPVQKPPFTKARIVS